MNDVRNLMQSLGDNFKYREFQNFTPGKRLAVVGELDHSEPAAPAEEGAPSPPAADAVLASRMRAAAAARATRGVGEAARLSLGKYRDAASAQAGDPRRLPLNEIFARLAAQAEAAA